MLEAEVVIAEVSTPSLGVGYEIASALKMGKPTLCLYREGQEVSKMITGNTSALISLAPWSDMPAIDRHVDAFLDRFARHTSDSPHPGQDEGSAERNRGMCATPSGTCP